MSFPLFEAPGALFDTMDRSYIANCHILSHCYPLHHILALSCNFLYSLHRIHIVVYSSHNPTATRKSELLVPHQYKYLPCHGLIDLHAIKDMLLLL